jgi:hypothetical protein
MGVPPPAMWKDGACFEFKLQSKALAVKFLAGADDVSIPQCIPTITIPQLPALARSQDCYLEHFQPHIPTTFTSQFSWRMIG